jgi:hypothetical protein
VRLFRWAFYLVMFGAFVWFGTMVQLGNRSLFGHIVAIAHTKEAHELAEGTKLEAEKVAEKVKHDLASDGGAAPQKAEQLDDADRKELQKLVKAKSHP